MLGLRPHESGDLADPYGLFRSRAMTGARGTPRLVLNLAPGPVPETRTRAQHIAFTTTTSPQQPAASEPPARSC